LRFGTVRCEFVKSEKCADIFVGVPSFHGAPGQQILYNVNAVNYLVLVVNDVVAEFTNNEQRARKLREYPPSAKLVFRTLERNGTMTINDIEKQTYLPHRTVRYAIKRLKEGGIVTQLFYIKDARQSLYRLAE
jgi:DNA-binding transcriptional ArsR family regulator